MVLKFPYPLLKFRLVTIWLRIGYNSDKFGDFQRSFKGTSKCFYHKVFRIELRCEWVKAAHVLVQPSSTASLVPNPQVTVRPYIQ